MTNRRVTTAGLALSASSLVLLAASLFTPAAGATQTDGPTVSYEAGDVSIYGPQRNPSCSVSTYFHAGDVGASVVVNQESLWIDGVGTSDPWDDPVVAGPGHSMTSFVLDPGETFLVAVSGAKLVPPFTVTVDGTIVVTRVTTDPNGRCDGDEPTTTTEAPTTTTEAPTTTTEAPTTTTAPPEPTTTTQAPTTTTTAPAPTTTTQAPPPPTTTVVTVIDPLPPTTVAPPVFPTVFCPAGTYIVVDFPPDLFDLPAEAQLLVGSEEVLISSGLVTWVEVFPRAEDVTVTVLTPLVHVHCDALIDQTPVASGAEAELPFTGASHAGLYFRIGVTGISAGIVLVLIGRRRLATA